YKVTGVQTCALPIWDGDEVRPLELRGQSHTGERAPAPRHERRAERALLRALGERDRREQVVPLTRRRHVERRVAQPTPQPREPPDRAERLPRHEPRRDVVEPADSIAPRRGAA